MTLAPLLLLAPRARAQDWSGGAQFYAATPIGTMDDYFGTGTGFGLVLHGPKKLRFDGTWSHFGTTNVQRPLGGSGSVNIGIGSSAEIITVLGGPELEMPLESFRLTFGGQAGLGYVQSTGSTVLPGDPQKVQRSNTYGTFTYAAAGRFGIAHRLGSGRVALGYAFVFMGEADFLTENNLPIGVISGIYLNPTPYHPNHATWSVALTFPL